MVCESAPGNRETAISANGRTGVPLATPLRVKGKNRSDITLGPRRPHRIRSKRNDHVDDDDDDFGISKIVKQATQQARNAVNSINVGDMKGRLTVIGPDVYIDGRPTKISSRRLKIENRNGVTYINNKRADKIPFA